MTTEATETTLGELTPRQLEYIDAIVSYLCVYGMMPTYRDMMRVMRIKSPNGVWSTIGVLVKKGWVTDNGIRGAGRSSGAKRGMVLTPAAAEHLRSVSADGGLVRVRLLTPEVALSPAEARRLATRLLRAAEDAASGEGVSHG